MTPSIYADGSLKYAEVREPEPELPPAPSVERRGRIIAELTRKRDEARAKSDAKREEGDELPVGSADRAVCFSLSAFYDGRESAYQDAITVVGTTH